ncbi:MAG: GGDEF domain-containing protein [Alphaproteobacteria bacterium]|nr:GGDEF domain-containing protein [Alphaproteobacteria bacterium]
MKIGETRQVGGSAGVARLRPASGAERAGQGGATRAVSDTMEVLGIPEAEFTPKVRAAIAGLLDEVGKLRQELEHSKKRIAQLEKIADEDTLVPVANRRSFVRELSRMLSYAQRYGGDISVLYFDINDMKSVNDSHGHAAGDAAITHVAALLTGSIRESDIVGRLGGDEFGVILANAPEEEAVQKAEHLRRLITETPFQWKGETISVAISAGAYALQGGEDASTMLDQADQAMYAQKPVALGLPG